MHCWAIIAAAGSGSRLREAGIDRPKQFLELDGVPLYWHSARTFARVAGISGIVFVFPPQAKDLAGEETALLAEAEDFPLPCRFAAGGDTRQDSVRNALAALPPECTHVLVHDAARPFMTARLAAAVLDGLRAHHAAVIPGVPLVDTIKRVDGSGLVHGTIDRNSLRAVQTPQGFSRAHLTEAHAKALADNLAVTDDAALLELLGIPVFVTMGDAANKKITTPADLALLEKHGGDDTMTMPRTGFGYDVHAYGGNRPLILGGVPIPSDYTVAAHSDGDVLLHALIDAILGCLGRGDIGTLFPDSDRQYAGIESGILLSEVLRLAFQDNFAIAHADMTIVAQAPKIAPYREQIAANVARLLALPVSCVNVKATTEEKLGFTGEKKGLKAYAVVTGVVRQR
ncbi:Bifunctional enzyme IspD/IspF (Includes: 2-C-methyl-D-erythritol 4-phosphate cytidylyltransferase; 2-C-methyl-D-erythritol 2,4-cyclodiphosphate synthase) [uncultured delta proteobacterium]|uniref:Bifunctional enzyme IspD/IspF n=1 Tax=uncultured delta proteobacterium TaxID=34034 RepID=A0A212JEH5_9DELT|nr:Bifunctional enzyme IspD/IspF (Includes: 2-C-methyl-D-erythritol 4-phosphate cytidylyltransferase; 2-C-methyl-D-erythritol 2,4-cyclodiphosphate synthase) [uncultured delta proteobacterium]